MRKMIFLWMTLLIVTAGGIAHFLPSYKAAQLQQGVRGEAVVEIQKKLKKWGYYTGKTEGIYGPQTAAAVRAFQRRNGLTADGVVGEDTRIALGILERVGQEASPSEGMQKELLAQVINQLGAEKSYEGQVAIGAVVLNRVRHPSFPNTLGGVTHQLRDFSSARRAPMALSAYQAAEDALQGWDPTGGLVWCEHFEK